jgi:hypothetical protein
MTGPYGPTGAGGALGYWGSFWSTQDQQAAGTTGAYPITYNNTDPNSNGVSIVSNSQITFSYPGVYNIEFSAQADRVSGSGTDTIDIWFRKNGTDIADSNTIITVSGGAAAAKTVAAWNYMLQVNANDYVELMWRTSDTRLEFIADPAGTNPTRPAIPSVILSAHQVMYTQLGPTGPTGPMPTDYVSSFNGKTGAVQGVSSINGNTGAITNVAFTNTAQTFTGLQTFSSGISGSGATFGGSIVLQNGEFLTNSTNGRVDIMPAPSGSTHFGIYFDNTSWGFGTILGTIRSSDGAINTGGNFRFDVPLTIVNDTRFQFGNDGHYGVYRSTTGNDTGQLYALSNNASNSGAIALVNYFAVGNANRSPGTTHVHPNFYIYANGTTSANDFMRLEHDSTRGIIETGGTSGLTLKPGSGAVAIENKLILGITGFNGTSTPGCLEFDGNVLYAGTSGGRGVVEAAHISYATSSVSLTGVTTYQNIFSAPADVITLAANTSYIVEGNIIVQSGTTTHTTALRLSDGVAGVSPIFRLHILSTAAAAGTIARAQDTVYFETNGGVINSTSTSTRVFILLRGSIETGSSVTITPQVAFSANPSNTNQIQDGSWIKFTPVGTSTMTFVGPWS